MASLKHTALWRALFLGAVFTVGCAGTTTRAPVESLAPAERARRTAARNELSYCASSTLVVERVVRRPLVYQVQYLVTGCGGRVGYVCNLHTCHRAPEPAD